MGAHDAGAVVLVRDLHHRADELPVLGLPSDLVCYIYIFIQRSGRNKTHTRKHATRKIEEKHKNTYLTNNELIKQLTNNVNRMLTSVNKLLLLRETIHAKLLTPVLRISNCTQQIITSMKCSFCWHHQSWV